MPGWEYTELTLSRESGDELRQMSRGFVDFSHGEKRIEFVSHDLMKVLPA
jgi:hypothetical protein